VWLVFFCTKHTTVLNTTERNESYDNVGLIQAKLYRHNKKNLKLSSFSKESIVHFLEQTWGHIPGKVTMAFYCPRCWFSLHVQICFFSWYLWIFSSVYPVDWYLSWRMPETRVGKKLKSKLLKCTYLVFVFHLVSESKHQKNSQL
jgi:hypothetical protein